jgi:hypothetical protein
MNGDVCCHTDAWLCAKYAIIGFLVGHLLAVGMRLTV